MNALNPPNASMKLDLVPATVPRARLVRDQGARERFGLRAGEAYRIAYLAGGAQVRRVSRSVVVFMGVSDRRRWDGDAVACLDFVLPQGRPLSILSTQLVDVRAAALNERGQWVLLAQDALRSRQRGSRRAPGAR